MPHKFPTLCGFILLDKEIAKGFSGVTTTETYNRQTNLSVPSFASRLLVSEANVSTVLFLDRMVLAVNGYLFLDG
jgi:hypothetical protein